MNGNIPVLTVEGESLAEEERRKLGAHFSSKAKARSLEQGGRGRCQLLLKYLVFLHVNAKLYFRNGTCSMSLLIRSRINSSSALFKKLSVITAFHTIDDKRLTIVKEVSEDSSSQF